jgi:hypothetical protein
MADDVMPPLPCDAQAALLFVDGGLMLHYRTPSNGIAVKPLALDAVRAAFSHIPVDSGWLPPEVRRWGLTDRGPFAVAAFPAARYRLKIQLPACKKMQRLDVPLPPVVWCSHARDYAVWALLDPFGPEARLAHVPLPNVHAGFGMGHNICWGANQPLEATPTGSVRAWQMFIRTPFNDHLIDHKSNAHPRDVRLALMAAASAERYPLDDLFPLGITLGQAVSRFLGLSSETEQAAFDDDNR